MNEMFNFIELYLVKSVQRMIFTMVDADAADAAIAAHNEIKSKLL